MYYPRIRVTCFLMVLVFVLNGCKKEAPPVTVGIQLSPAMALLMVAKDQNFFEDEGLNVELKAFTAGKFALQAFLGGSLDIAVPGDVPTTLAQLQGSRFVILSQVVERTQNEVRMVVRRDASATDPATYFRAKRRKLATSFGGGPEFFTYSFFKHYNIDPKSVDIVSQKPEDMPAALRSGSVDAVAIFDPFAYIAEQQMGGGSITFMDPALYSELYLVVAQQDFVSKNPDLARRFLHALVRASDFARSDSASAKKIVAKYTKLDASVVDGIWGNFVFAPALTGQLVEYQKAEAEWAAGKGIVPANSPLPDFKQFINPVPLKEVKPDAVKLP